MLFQPTNITPSLSGGVGNGVVDITSGLNLYWQVNGNSPMTKFQIDIYNNDSTSTLLYSTGTLTDNCPFYGVDYVGNVNMFQYTISSAALAIPKKLSYASSTITNVGIVFSTFATKIGSVTGVYTFTYNGAIWSLGAVTVNLDEYGITLYGAPSANDTITVSYNSGNTLINGRNYKFIITQYYGTDSFVRQSSANAFITRVAPTISINTIVTPVTTNTLTVTATYSQPQGDTISFARWYFGVKNGNDYDIIDDTGNVYGVLQLQYVCDGLFSGSVYAVKCAVQTSSGVDIDTSWVDFTVTYSGEPITGALVAKCDNSVNGVNLSFPEISYIPATQNGTVTMSNGYAYIGDNGWTPATGSLTYNTVNGASMNFQNPLAIVWRGRAFTTSSGENRFFDYNFSNGTYDKHIIFKYSSNANSYSISFGAISQEISISPFNYITIIVSLSEKTIYISKIYNNVVTVLQPIGFPSSFDIDNYNITELYLGSVQYCDYLFVGKDEFSESSRTLLLNDYTYHPINLPRYFLADYNNGYGGGSVETSNIVNLAVYRFSEGDSVLTRIYTASLGESQITDIVPVSNKDYTYYAFGITNNQYTSSFITSNTVVPHFWNWSVYVCEQDANDVYHPTAIYLFSGNLSSGAISNNSSPTLLQNFTRYPTYQSSPFNYKSGTLNGLIGTIVDGVYSDTVDLRQAIYDLSTNGNTLFIKDRKGELIKIRINGAITMTTDDKAANQPQTMQLPWVEIGSTDNDIILITQDDII